MARRRKKKANPEIHQKTWPNWQPVSGLGFSTYDSYGRATPSTTDLLSKFNDVVYSCITLIADTVATTQVKLFVKTDQGERRPKCRTSPISYKTLEKLRQSKTLARTTSVEEVVNHPAIDLLRRCNPYHGWHGLAWLTQAYKETAGDSYWFLKKDAFGLPIEVYILNPAKMEPIRNDHGFIVGWRYNIGPGQVEYSLDDIIHFKVPALTDPYGMGFSPLRAVWDRVQISFKELGYLDATLSNMGRPDAILSPQDSISPFEGERLAKEYNQRFRTQGAGGVFVADGPMTLTPLNFQPQSMAELQVYAQLKNAISNVYHVPCDLWELGEANRATADAILYALAVHCIRPRMCQLVETLNEKLIPYYDERLFFEATEIVPEDRQFLKEERDMLLKNGVITRDEARIRYGFDEEDWAKEPLLPPGSMPLSVSLAQQRPPIDTAPKPIDRSTQAPAILALQQAVGAGQVTAQAARANAQILFNLTPEEATALFPDAPAPVHQPANDQGADSEAPATPEQAPAAASNDLRATVGGSVAVADLQRSYYRRELPKEACIQNSVLIFGFTPEEASLLFPELPPNAPQAAPAAPGSAPTPPGDTQPEQPDQAKAKAIDVPDVRQQQPFDCGPAATAAVCQYFQVGPAEESDYLAPLGTTPEEGTSPEAIVAYLAKVGLVATARDDMTVSDLAEATSNNSPVICCIQDASAQPEEVAKETAGHYVVVVGADDDTISLHDPLSGKVELPTLDFLARWEDGGYVHYGIIVSKPVTKAIVKNKAVKSAQPFAEALAGFFRKQSQQVMARVKMVKGKALPLPNWFDIEAWSKEMYEVMRPIVAIYYDESADETVTRIGASPELLKVVADNLREGADKATLLFCRETNETTSQELDKALTSLRESLTEGLEAGEVQNQLSQRVQTIFEQAEVTRAYQIAVTEASRSQHAAQQITAEASGIVKGKRWLLSDDACPLCLPLANKVVPLNESFMQDGTGPYSNIEYPPRHPHCRCDMIEVVEGVNE